MISIKLEKFGYNISNKKLSESLFKMLGARGGKKTHRHPTRRKTMPNIQYHTSGHSIRAFCANPCLKTGNFQIRRSVARVYSLGQVLKWKKILI